MVSFIMLSIITAYALVAALSWMTIFKSNIKYLSALLAFSAIIQWYDFIPQMYSLILLIISVAIVTWTNKTGALKEAVKNIRPGHSLKEQLIIGTYQFTYTNADGGIAARKVDVYEIWHNEENGYFKGYCHKAKAERTFRMDRVQGQVTDINTGETINI